jgi:hypothetical protein
VAQDLGSNARKGAKVTEDDGPGGPHDSTRQLIGESSARRTITRYFAVPSAAQTVGVNQETRVPDQSGTRVPQEASILGGRTSGYYRRPSRRISNETGKVSRA